MQSGMTALKLLERDVCPQHHQVQVQQLAQGLANLSLKPSQPSSSSAPSTNREATSSGPDRPKMLAHGASGPSSSVLPIISASSSAAATSTSNPAAATSICNPAAKKAKKKKSKKKKKKKPAKKDQPVPKMAEVDGVRREVPGTRWDSDASDREEDPAIEEDFILRMMPGQDCDYLRQVIECRELNTSTDVWIKFKYPRKAVVSIRGNLYAALLVDLPHIIEANKSLDMRNFIKVADICQMLLVTQRIPNEEALEKVKFKVPNEEYPHGLTPPLYGVRYREKPRKRIGGHDINKIEATVERLLRKDAKALSTSYTIEYVYKERKSGMADKAKRAEKGAHSAHSAKADKGKRVDKGGHSGLDCKGKHADRDGRTGLASSGGAAASDNHRTVVYNVELDADGEMHHEYEDTPSSGYVFEAVEETLATKLEAALSIIELSSDEEDDADLTSEPDLDDAAIDTLLPKARLAEEIMGLERALEKKTAELKRFKNKELKERLAISLEAFHEHLKLKRRMLAELED
jgi:transcription initiation factor TFIID subunit 7